MPEPTMNHALAVVPDLFFSVKLAAVARAAGVELAFVAPGALFERCAASPPALVLIDLHAPCDPPALVRALKADARTRGIPVIGFYSHVETDLRRDALAAGIDEALPRSAFVNRLPALLAGTCDRRPEETSP